MPRISKKTILYSWILSVLFLIIVGTLTMVLFYLPYVSYTTLNTKTNITTDTILKLNSIPILSADVFFFTLKVDIMDMTWLTLFLFFLFPAYYYRKDFLWRNRVDAYLPYLLRELSDAQKIGLPLPRAIIEASKLQFGPLTEELKMMAAKISWGVPFSETLRAMASRIDTSLFRRTSVLILEAERSGGQTEEIFESAYVHVSELLSLDRERRASMSPYKWIILIAFVVFSLIIIILLNSFFVPLVIADLPKGQQAQSFGGVPLNLGLLQLIFFHILIIEGAFSGVISSKMSNGRVSVGLVQTLVMITLAYVIFKLGALSIG